MMVCQGGIVCEDVKKNVALLPVTAVTDSNRRKDQGAGECFLVIICCKNSNLLVGIDRIFRTGQVAFFDRLVI